MARSHRRSAREQPWRPVPRHALALLLSVCGATAHAQDDSGENVGDAFGRRIGVESIGLYSESLVRGFNLQQAGNYRLGDAWFARAATPPDTIVTGSQVRLGPGALQLDFPAPSGIVQYHLLPGERRHARIELGFQHLLDSNPRPYARAYFTERGDDGAWSLSGGAIGTPSAHYIYGNEARYHGLGLVPRARLGERWEVVGFYGYYDQRFQADVGFSPAPGTSLPETDRRRYLGQPWSRFDTRNTTYGAVLSTQPKANGWDYSLSGVHSRVVRPRSDFNLFTNVAPDGATAGSVIVARDRDVFARAFEATARRDWSGTHRQDTLALVARSGRTTTRNPRTQVVDLGGTSLFGDISGAPEPGDDTGAHSFSTIEQQELGISWQQQRASGHAINLGLRRVRLDQTARSADDQRTARESADWLYNASLVVPVSEALTVFASAVRGVEEAGIAPQNARNRFEALPPVLARQSELGLKWQSPGGVSVIGAAFEIEKPEPGLDADNVYRYIGTANHRGIELSVAGKLRDNLELLLGASWLRPRLSREATDGEDLGARPVGRPARIAVASLQYQPEAWRGLSLDADASYYGSRPADRFDRSQTPAYTLLNLGARYRFDLGGIPAALRLRVYNATDKFAWYANSSGLRSYQPARRVMLSLTLGD